VANYVDAAKRVQEAGFDGVECRTNYGICFTDYTYLIPLHSSIGTTISD